MSGVRPTHLQRRGGTFHLRVRVPTDIRAQVGVLEIRRSLRVHSLSKARPLALKYAARLMEVFVVIRELALSKGQTRDLVATCFIDLAKDAERGFCPTSADPAEVGYQRLLSDERMIELQGEVTAGVFSAPVRQAVRRLVWPYGVDLDACTDDVQLDIVSGVARAFVEEQRLFLHRLNDRLLAYQPTDPLFADYPESAGRTAIRPIGAESVATILPTRERAPVGPRIGELVERYLRAKRVQWTPKTLNGRRRQLAYLVENLGADTAAATIRPEHVREIRDGIRRLRSNHHVGAGRTFISRQTENEEHQINAKTALVIFEAMKAFFRWAKADGYLTANPAEDIRLEMPKRLKGLKARRPFTGEELVQLFSAPVFTGCKAPKRRFETGAKVIRDAKYWIPLIGFLTGMRLGEIVQLHLRDVRLEGPIPYIEVTEAESGALGSGEEKHVKSDAGVRLIPLHHDLMELGFAQFVQTRLADPRARTRLFWEVGYGADGQPSTAFSKWFGRLLDKCDLTDPALVFHSFRHGVEDALRDALQPQYVIDRIVGHSDGSTSAGYGQGVALDVAYEAVRAMKLKASVRSILGAPAAR